MDKCIFCKIAKREIPKEFLYEDDDIMVFHDIHPRKPIHMLIIPKQHIEEILKVSHPEIFSKIFTIVQEMAKKSELRGKGFQISINGGGAQEINHFHVHLMGPVEKSKTL